VPARRLVWIAIALVSSLLLVAGLWRLSNSRTSQLFGDLVASVPCDQKLVALTLDDGPTPEGTQPLLDLLARHDVRATFFLVGRDMRLHPELAPQLVAAGHELGNHSYNHQRMLLRWPASLRHELDETDAAIRDAGFRGPIFFRPPYGKKLIGLPWVLRQSHRTSVTWSLEPESTPGVAATPEAMAAYVSDHITPGSIVLLHAMIDPEGIKRRTLDLLLPAVRARGYRWVTVGELLATSRPRR
jgi:peptidoglycan/xylan/chitin deacetylase (PgdA/CDA1 family)